VDSGQMRLHAIAPTGTRIEETEVLFSKSTMKSGT
jgi:hypothetical protein